MGQYYRFVCPGKGESMMPRGVKLMEHAWVGNHSVDEVLCAVTDGRWKGEPVASVGDYAWDDPDDRGRLVEIGIVSDPWSDSHGLVDVSPDPDGPAPHHHRFVANLDLGEYYDRERCPVSCVWAEGTTVKCDRVDPLPILLAVGNGKGCGDYSGPGEGDAGLWAGCTVRGYDERPVGLEEVEPYMTEADAVVRGSDAEVRDAAWAALSLDINDIAAALSRFDGDRKGLRAAAKAAREKVVPIVKALPPKAVDQAFLCRPFTTVPHEAPWRRLVGTMWDGSDGGGRIEAAFAVASGRCAVIAYEEERPIRDRWDTDGSDLKRHKKEMERFRSEVRDGLIQLCRNAPGAIGGADEFICVPSQLLPKDRRGALAKAEAMASATDAASVGRGWRRLRVRCSAPLTDEAKERASAWLLESECRDMLCADSCSTVPGVVDAAGRPIGEAVLVVTLGAMTVAHVDRPGELGRDFGENDMEPWARAALGAFRGCMEAWSVALRASGIEPRRCKVDELCSGPFGDGVKAVMGPILEAVCAGVAVEDATAGLRGEREKEKPE